MQISNSGLPRPIYCHDGEIEIIEATGLPLGLFDEAEYDEFSFQANAGDLFVFFSDGILDATDTNGDLFEPATESRPSSNKTASFRRRKLWTQSSKRWRNMRPAAKPSTIKPF